MATKTLTNPDLDIATNELMVDGIIEEVFQRMPFYAAMLEKNRMSFRNGKSLTRILSMANVDSLAQNYGPTTPLSTGDITTLAKPYFDLKHFQLPITYDLNEWLMAGGNGKAVNLDIVARKVKKAQAVSYTHLRAHET